MQEKTRNDLTAARVRIRIPWVLQVKRLGAYSAEGRRAERDLPRGSCRAGGGKGVGPTVGTGWTVRPESARTVPFARGADALCSELPGFERSAARGKWPCCSTPGRVSTSPRSLEVDRVSEDPTGTPSHQAERSTRRDTDHGNVLRDRLARSSTRTRHGFANILLVLRKERLWQEGLSSTLLRCCR